MIVRFGNLIHRARSFTKSIKSNFDLFGGGSHLFNYTENIIKRSEKTYLEAKFQDLRALYLVELLKFE